MKRTQEPQKRAYAVEDILPKKVDCVYLFGETKENETSVLDEGVRLLKMFPQAKLGICETDTPLLYRGMSAWTKEIKKRRGDIKRIIGIPPAHDLFPPSTSAEAAGLVRKAIQEKWKDVIVVAPPFHEKRAFITTASNVVKQKAKIRIWSHPGTPQDWEEVAVNSSSTPPMSRKEELKSERKKIKAYRKDGDIISEKEIKEYIKWRNKTAANF